LTLQEFDHEFFSIVYTLQGTNISHLGNRKIIFKMPFWGDMLVPWRVISLSEWNPEIKSFEGFIFPTKYVIPKSFKL